MRPQQGLSNQIKSNTDRSLGSNRNDCKLFGGARPKIIKAPKLRVITSTKHIIDVISTVIRSFNPIWHFFDTHQKCPLKREKNCTFCAMRSLSQWLNQQKREPSIHPHELQIQEETIEVNCKIDMLVLYKPITAIEFRKK